MDGYIYILRTKGDHFYIGSTNNLERRIIEHQIGKTRSLKNLLPTELVFYQKYNNLEMARKIERKLKKFKNKKIIERIIADNTIKMDP